MNSRLKDLLSISEVKDGILEILTATREDMIQLYDLLSNALMNCKIPHYKVIGAYIPGNAYGIENFISKQAGVNKSYTELYKALNNLIFATNENECTNFYSYNLDLTKVEDIGFLQAEGYITSSNDAIYFKGGKEAKALVENVEIVSLNRGLVLQFMIAKSTSIIDFTESEFLIKNYFKSNNMTNQYLDKLVPIRAVYDLNRMFLLKPYIYEDGNKLYFIYKKKINEKVLTKIIQNFIIT